jgi:hypothetical protein
MTRPGTYFQEKNGSISRETLPLPSGHLIHLGYFLKAFIVEDT